MGLGLAEDSLGEDSGVDEVAGAAELDSGTGPLDAEVAGKDESSGVRAQAAKPARPRPKAARRDIFLLMTTLPRRTACHHAIFMAQHCSDAQMSVS